MMTLEKHNTVTAGKGVKTIRFCDLKFVVIERIYDDV